MNARQNPLKKLEAFMQRMVEGPFAWLFPSHLEPVEIMRKLERAMEDNTLLQGDRRRLAPNIYDVYLSPKDHQQLSTGQDVLIRDWQNHLVDFARHRHYTLRTVPVIRLHGDTSLRTGIVRIESAVADKQGGGGDGVMATQAISAEQLAQLRAQLAPGIAPSGPGMAGHSSPQYPAMPSGPHSQPPRVAGNSSPAYSGGPSSMPGLGSQPGYPGISPHQATPPSMPQAWMTIRLPQGGQQIYRIEKPIIHIGRQLSNDIIVEDKRVSRYHAQIKFQPDGQFAIFDLGSTNGITINNTPHMRQHVLHNGDRFTIGSYDFYFERR